MTPVQSDAMAARALVESTLAQIGARARGRVAAQVVASLAAAGFFRRDVECCFSATSLAERWGRSREWVVGKFAAGRFGPVYRDDGGWLIPAITAQNYLDEHQVCRPSVEEVTA